MSTNPTNRVTHYEVPRFEVIDIRLLAFHHPDLVNVEPNSEAIEMEIRRGHTHIKGLHCWMDTKEAKS